MALLRYALIACSIGLALPACTQDEDDACQVDGDCADGLICSRGNDIRGTCVPVGTEREDAAIDQPDDGDETVDEGVSTRDGGDDDAG